MTEADKLRWDLDRFRYLLSYNTDRRVVESLRELIAEAEARLHAIEEEEEAATPRKTRDDENKHQA